MLRPQANLQVTEYGLEPLLGLGEPEAVRVLNPESQSALVLAVEHASSLIPEIFEGMGLSRPQRQSAQAMDSGALLLAEKFAQASGATVVIANYSRLVIDVSLPLDHADSIPMMLEQQTLAANLALTKAERKRRQDALFWPFHLALAEQLQERELRGQPAQLLTMGTFSLGNLPVHMRDWHINLQFDADRRLVDVLQDGLCARQDIKVGFNQPVSSRGAAHYTRAHHAAAHGVTHAHIAFAKDLLDSDTQIEYWAQTLQQIMQGCPKI